MALVPPWTRVYRIQRDIPMPLVTSGVEYGNLRQLVLKRMQDLGLPCRDVRTREVGIKRISSNIEPGQVRSSIILLAVHSFDHIPYLPQSQCEISRLSVSPQVELVRRDYVANGGWETFLAYEDPRQDILIGLLRLRQCSADSFRPELAEYPCSLVRELHVYGSAVPVHARDPTKFQHQGQSGALFAHTRDVVSRPLPPAFSFISLPSPISISLSRYSLSLSRSRRLRHAAHGGGGAHRARGARVAQAGHHRRRGHAALLPEAGVRARRALHVQVAVNGAGRMNSYRQSVKCILGLRTTVLNPGTRYCGHCVQLDAEVRSPRAASLCGSGGCSRVRSKER